MPKTTTRAKRRPKRPPKEDPPKTLPISALAPPARREALRLAKGKRSRIEVLSPTSAIVR